MPSRAKYRRETTHRFVHIRSHTHTHLTIDTFILALQFIAFNSECNVCHSEPTYTQWRRHYRLAYKIYIYWSSLDSPAKYPILMAGTLSAKIHSRISEAGNDEPEDRMTSVINKIISEFLYVCIVGARYMRMCGWAGLCARTENRICWKRNVIIAADTHILDTFRLASRSLPFGSLHHFHVEEINSWIIISNGAGLRRGSDKMTTKNRIWWFGDVKCNHKIGYSRPKHVFVATQKATAITLPPTLCPKTEPICRLHLGPFNVSFPQMRAHGAYSMHVLMSAALY